MGRDWQGLPVSGIVVKTVPGAETCNINIVPGPVQLLTFNSGDFLHADDAMAVGPRPKIVCLCGSTRFRDAFAEAGESETLAGNVVLSPGCFSRSTPEEAARGVFADVTEEEKAALDELHKRKIDLADEILVVNVGGYIGDSTRSEIDYAKSTGKPVRWLEPVS